MSDPIADSKPDKLGMGDVSDLGKVAIRLKASAATLAAVEIAAGAIASISAIGTVVVAAVAVLSFLFGKSDELTDKVEQLLADLKILIGGQQAEDQILQMQAVGLQLEDARTQLLTLREDDPTLKSQIGIVLNNSFQVVNKLGNIAFWQRPFFQTAVYSDSWSGFLSPPLVPLPAGSAAVFDYRLTLPAYLEAIVIRLVILSALVPNFRQSRRFLPELRKMAERLEGFYITIRDGIIEIPSPGPFPGQPVFYREVVDFIPETLHDDQHIPAKIETRIVPSLWDSRGRPYGAVERYSAVAVIDQYPTDHFPTAQDALLIDPVAERAMETGDIPFQSGRFPSIESYQRFLLRHAIGTLARRKAVYRVVGLPALKTIVNLLKDLASEPRLPTLPDGDWSLREIDNTIATILLRQPSIVAPHSPISVKALLGMLDSGPFGSSPTSMRQAFNV
jgi:hypothetical protein